MGEKSRISFIVIIALILAAAVIYSFSVSNFQRTPSVGLADVNASPGAGDTQPDPFGDMTLIDVTPDTVQSVIETLDRYASYRRTITVEYFSGGETVGMLTAAVAVDGGWTRADVTEQSGLVEHSVLGDDTRWLWYNNEENYVEAAVTQEGAEDLMQRIPTYEDVLRLDQSHITAATYERRGELPCVYVEVYEPELEYLERFWVSVESGLLVSSETVKGEEVVYRMSAYEVESPLPDGTGSFTLPDGTVLHHAEG